MRRVRVLVVAADPLARGGLEALLTRMVTLEVVGTTAPAGMPDALSRLSPDVLVADLGPDGRGLDAPREVPGVALLGDVAQAGGALAEGWRGVLPRDAGAEALSAAVGAVAAGLAVADAAALASLAPDDDDAPAGPREPLTPREAEVLQLLAAGLSNRRIGQQLGISEHTAKFHVAAVLAKLDARTRTDAVVKAARLGLVLL